MTDLQIFHTYVYIHNDYILYDIVHVLMDYHSRFLIWGAQLNCLLCILQNYYAC